MAAADRHSGKDVHLSYTPTAGSAIDLDVDYRNLEWSQELNEIDATAGDDDYEYFLTSFKRSTFNVSILAGATTTYLIPGSVGSLVYGPEGSGASARRVTLPVILTNASEAGGYAEVMTLDLTFRATGTPVVDAFSA